MSLDKRPGVDFTVVYEPGDWISDRSTKAARESADGEVTYIAPADNSTLRNIAKGVRKNRVILLVGIVVIFACLGWVFWRRSQASN